MSRYSYFAVYKPFDYLSQFTQEVPGQLTLRDLYEFPSDVYPIGRLDRNSEGLLLLSNDKSLTEALLNPSANKYKTYYVQVEGRPDEIDLNVLRRGQQLRIRKKMIQTQPALADFLPDDAMPIPPRVPPVRYRKSIPDTWLQISIKEGKYHQVRKMCAAIGFPVLRLIRIVVGPYQLPELTIGRVWEIEDRKQVLPS